MLLLVPGAHHVHPHLLPRGRHTPGLLTLLLTNTQHWAQLLGSNFAGTSSNPPGSLHNCQGPHLTLPHCSQVFLRSCLFPSLFLSVASHGKPSRVPLASPLLPTPSLWLPRGLTPLLGRSVCFSWKCRGSQGRISTRRRRECQQRVGELGGRQREMGKRAERQRHK